MLTNSVLLSVVVMITLSLLKTNILIALIVAALTGGVLAGMPLSETMEILISGMGGNAETALSYVLLGALAAAIGKTGAADMLARRIGGLVKDKKFVFILLIAGIASLSQNLIPVHIAFIPILIPPLIGVMNNLKIDRRAVATALTFGLKAPYVSLPVGFGLLFHKTIADALTANGLPVDVGEVWHSMIYAGLGMLIGLLVAVFITYRKPREYEDIQISANDTNLDEGIKKEHIGALLGAAAAFGIQIVTQSLPLGALAGLGIMLLFGSIGWTEMDEMMNEGIKIMGFIAFVMLVAAGYGEVIRQSGGVEQLVEASVAIMGGSKVIAVFVIIFIGLIITMGIGSSFATVPILAVIVVPITMEMGFSTAATIALVGIASAVGDAGSPASDSTLGPTSGLNVDGQHDHIKDTVIPTFTHFSVPLMITAVITGLLL